MSDTNGDERRNTLTAYWEALDQVEHRSERLRQMLANLDNIPDPIAHPILRRRLRRHRRRLRRDLRVLDEGTAGLHQGIADLIHRGGADD
jgi:phosphoenolpyruvate carboxylase